MGQPSVLPPDIGLTDLHRLCATTAAAYREGHQMVVGSREHSQTLMVWLCGLMGAGIFSVHGLLSSAPTTMRLGVFIPWTAGVLSAALSGLLSGELAERNDQQHFGRVSTLELLQLQTDRDSILQKLRPIIEPRVPANDKQSITLYRWLTATNATFYLAYVFLMVGAAAAATTIIILGK